MHRRTGAADLQSLELGFAGALNRKYLNRVGADSELAARIKSFETAYKMQFEAPDVFDLSKESDETLKLYGFERGQDDSFGWQCLMARRLVERGVRFVELIDTGSSNNWDAHENLTTYEPLAKKIDQPIAGLLADLKRRGMLDDTLVVWTTEFGRTPGQQTANGRGHHPAVFSSWLAGGGVKGGIVHGKSDEIGATVTENRVHVHDFHATILHLLGLDHERLTYRHAGRDFRLTDVSGNVVHEIIA
jgi:membrane-anchored protein YejM (alkaline phosphatase superfamily)